MPVKKDYVQIQSSNFYQILRFIIENQAKGLVIDERNSVQNFSLMTVRMDKPENLIPKSKRVEAKQDEPKPESTGVVESESSLDVVGEGSKEVETQPKPKKPKPAKDEVVNLPE